MKIISITYAEYTEIKLFSMANFKVLIKMLAFHHTKTILSFIMIKQTYRSLYKNGPDTHHNKYT